MNTKKPKISLRPATEADALCLDVLATHVFLDTYTFTGITETVANEVLEAFSTEAVANILAGTPTFITVAVHENALYWFIPNHNRNGAAPCAFRRARRT